MDYEYSRLRAQVAILRDVVADYGENRSIGNVIMQLDARLKEIENKSDN